MNNRLFAYVLIVVGFFILLSNWLSFGTIVALIMIALGIRKIQDGDDDAKLSYLLLGIGAGILLLEHLALFIGILLASLVIFYYRSRTVQKNLHIRKRHNFITRFKWDREPYHLSTQSMWHIVGECDMDLSLAIVGENETTLLFQGIFGDIDVMIPDDIGVDIEATVWFGQIGVGYERETGFYNKWCWRSSNYDTVDQRVKLNLSYIVGDIDIRLHG